MNKLIVFILGIAAGVILTLVVSSYVRNVTPDNNLTEEETESEQMEGVTNFDEPGDIIEEKSFKVFQVVAKNAALVYGKDKYGDFGYSSMIYLLVNDNGKYYYDDEIVKVPARKVVRQMGIYHYPTKNGSYKTVPIVEILQE